MNTRSPPEQLNEQVQDLTQINDKSKAKIEALESSLDDPECTPVRSYAACIVDN